MPMQPGRARRQDYEYERRGTANLFMLFAPLAGWRHMKVTDRRTALDFAHVLRDLSDVHFPEAEKIVLVMDNLNTHKLSTLYRARQSHGHARQPALQPSMAQLLQLKGPHKKCHNPILHPRVDIQLTHQSSGNYPKLKALSLLITASGRTVELGSSYAKFHRGRCTPGESLD